MQGKNARYKLHEYGFVRCSIGDIEQKKSYLVMGKVIEMACRRN
jgi:hypothetical protein